MKNFAIILFVISSLMYGCSKDDDNSSTNSTNTNSTSFAGTYDCNCVWVSTYPMTVTITESSGNYDIKVSDNDCSDNYTAKLVSNELAIDACGSASCLGCFADTISGGTCEMKSDKLYLEVLAIDTEGIIGDTYFTCTEK